MNRLFKTVPYNHQHEVFEISKDREYFALAMDMGTGKSKPVIDTAAHLYAKGAINALFITAPNDVHLNWVEKGGEIDKHLCDDIQRVKAAYLTRPKAKDRVALERIFDPNVLGLRIVTCNIEALVNKKGRAFVKKFLRLFNVLWVIDESTRIKNPSAKCTQRALANAKHACYRRILSGTMAPNTPFDLYTQYRFLDFWIFPQQTFTTFKAHYAYLRDFDKTNAYEMAILEKIPVAKRKYVKYIEKDEQGQILYRNLAELKRLRAPHTYYKKKVDCLDLPPRVYEKRYIKLTVQQQRMIKELHIQKAALFDDFERDPIEVLVRAAMGADTVRAKNALGVHLREQQIIGGHAKVGDTELIPFTQNPKLDTLLNLLDDIDERVIVWCRFTAEIEMIKKALEARYGLGSVATYYGATSEEERAKVRRTFKDADSKDAARWLISNPVSGGLGLTLNAASYVVWYSTDYDLLHYMQGNDRNYRIGQTRSVTVLSLIAPETIDARIMKALREKEALQNLVDGPADTVVL